MEWVYRSFETSLLGLAMALGLVACLTLGNTPSSVGSLSVSLPMLTAASTAP
jgi:hypothetical protein